MTTKETASQQIQSLVTRFEEQHDSYRAADYNETLTRRHHHPASILYCY